MRFEYNESKCHSGFWILSGRGQFDTLYCQDFKENVDAILKNNPEAIAYHLRQVKFMNAVAFGALIGVHKRQICPRGIKDYILEPSSFVRDVIIRLGIDRIIPIKGLPQNKMP